MDVNEKDLENMTYQVRKLNQNSRRKKLGTFRKGDTLASNIVHGVITPFTNNLEFYAIREIKNAASHYIRKSIAQDTYNVFQPMYSNVGASICSYLQSTCPDKFELVKDFWMRNVRSDMWFMAPYSMIFHKIDERTYLYARASVDSSGGVSIILYIWGKKMRREVKKLTFFERSTNVKGRAIKQVTISANDKNECSSSNGELDARTIETIFMNEDLKSKITNFITKWQSRGDLYKKANRCHKAGILLHGPAGTGKTSLIRAIATLFNATLIIINPNDIAKFNSVTDLKGEITKIPGFKMVLLEDIDVAMSMNREGANVDDRTTMNGLMQILDGMLSTNDTIFFATTNYIERLDPVVIRPGRFDLIEKMDNIEYKTALKMVNFFEIPNPESFLDSVWNEYALHDTNRKEDFKRINPALLENLIIQKSFENASDASEIEAEQCTKEENE